MALFRMLALSDLSAKLTSAMVWRLDFGTRYSWLLGGLVVIAAYISRQGFDSRTFLFFGLWLIGLGLIWLVPPLALRWL